MSAVIPVIVVCGAKGAGKSTLIECIAKMRNWTACSIQCSAAFSNQLQQINKDLQTKKVDYVIVECEDTHSLHKLIHDFLEFTEHASDTPLNLEYIVSVLDATTFLSNINSNVPTANQRTVSTSLIEQIEYSGILLLNKIDELPAETAAATIEQCEQLIRLLRPEAHVLKTTFAKITLADIFSGGGDNQHSKKFSFGVVAPLSFASFDSYSADSQSHFLFRSSRPFHPLRLWNLINADNSAEKPFAACGALRGKGIVWLATNMEECYEWSSINDTVTVREGLPWIKTPSKLLQADQQKQSDDNSDDEADSGYESDNDNTDVEAGEQRLKELRGQSILFIGTAINKDLLSAKLSECLLTDAELAEGMLSWALYEDHFAPKSESSNTLPLDEAVEQITHLIDQIDHDQLAELQRIITEKLQQKQQQASNPTTVANHREQINKDRQLALVVQEVRKATEISATAPKEKFYYPKHGQFAGYDKTNTIHVDAFLYDDDAVDDLCDNGFLSRNYCLDCGSKNTTPLNFISHSFSVAELKWIFSDAVLGDLTGKTIVDVGSRLGTVLYSGYLLSNAARIIGVEMNQYFADLQQQFIDKFNMSKRCKVVHADIFTQEQLIREHCDVLVMHDVFQFFTPAKEQKLAWQRIKALTQHKSGMRLVTCPSIQQSLADAKVNLSIDDWVREIPLQRPTSTDHHAHECTDASCTHHHHDDEEGEGEMNIHLYEVI